MRCETAEREISARLDGGAEARLVRAVDEHLTSCPRCRAFEADARRLRSATRLEPAVDVPDLVGPIMRSVERERAPRRIRPSRNWGRPAATFLAGAAASMLVLGGLPVLRQGVPPALAKEIPQLVAEASLRIDSYRATFDVVERNFHPDVVERTFRSTIEFRSPETLRSRVVDRTEYPTSDWPRNNISLSVEGSRWSVNGPPACPREAMPACGSARSASRTVQNRQPFDGDTPLPSDVVLPVRTLADAGRVSVTSTPSVLGRDTVGVRLTYRDAAPLFAYLHTAGTWRPFFPLDDVLVSLDRETWLPLAYRVRAAEGPERQRWALRNAVSADGDDEIFRAQARSFDLDVPIARSSPTHARPDATDAGFRDVLIDAPLVPKDLRGLRPYRTGRPAARSDEAFLSYTRGLAWLKIRETRSWDQPTLFGNISSLASRVRLSDGSVAYAEAATATLGRRLSIHTDDWDVFLESNIPFADLLAVAASLPVEGTDVPESWLTRTWSGGIVRQQLTLREALNVAPYMVVPGGELPASYDLANIHLVTAGPRRGVTLYYSRRGMEPDGIGLRLHLAPDTALPPPLDPESYAVRVDGADGRFAPERGELEWVSEGRYHSLTAMAFELPQLVQIAESLHRPS